MAHTTVVYGNTGLVGNQILAAVLGLDAFKTVYTFGRRAPKLESPKLQARIEPDTDKWPADLAGITPTPTVAFSALGTMRALAGGIANQWKIDHDLNVEIAKAAHGAGVKTFVFISSGGIRGPGASMVPYSQMKIGVEDAIKSLGFEQAIILQPGFLMGQRDREMTGGGVMSFVFGNLNRISQGFQDKFAQDAAVVGRAAVKAALLADQGKAPSKYWVLSAGDIVRLGRDEWES